MSHYTKVFVVSTALILNSCTPSVQKDYTLFVNPFIGTGGHGHTFPGATVPFGMIQPSPDTRIYGWDACSGYYYEDTTINGFSHTHLSGTGCCDLGDVLLMPTVGIQDYAWQGPESQRLNYCSPFSHENEQAEPGYYSVFLDRYAVKAELTASPRAAIHRYTFPESKEAGFILDFDYSLESQRNEEMFLEVVNNQEIRGHKKTVYWAFDQYANFHAKFSKPFTCKLIQDTVTTEKGDSRIRSKALLQFETGSAEEVLVKVALSAVDMEGALKNLDAEIPGWDFDGVRSSAKAKWNEYLSSIDVSTQNEDQQTIFYTGLYHTAIAPNLFTDADGRYLGMDRKVKQGDPSKPVYSTFSLWDTFRALHPLMTIINPDLNSEFIRSLLLKHQEGGIFPMWDLASNYTGTMIGYHATSLIADAIAKGQFDASLLPLAYEASKRAASADTSGINCPALVLPHLVTGSKISKASLGYAACDKDNESVAKGLEYAYDDWCIARIAEALGDKDGVEYFTNGAKSYSHYFDGQTMFMRGKDSEGNWRTPFNPRRSNHRSDDYCEGNAWQWSWFVPHDVEGLMSLMGGREAFVSRLDSLFLADSSLEGEAVSADISGLIGQYAHGNEPSHHVTHLYNYAGQPWKTQLYVDSVLQTLYMNAPDGLSGNEDCGQMSAWYIMNAMGFYQVCPGKPEYSIGRPLFDKVRIRTGNDTYFTVTTKNNSKESKYIRSIRLNGKELTTPFFKHTDLVSGGHLEIEMGKEPLINR